MKMAKKPTPAKSTLARTPVLEWATAALGLVLILGAIAVIVADGLAGDGSPPMIVVDRSEVVRTPGGWLVQFEARNLSHATAAEVQVTGVLRRSGAEPEERSVTLDYLPGGGRREGALLFSADPAAASLELAAEGYRAP